MYLGLALQNCLPLLPPLLHSKDLLFRAILVYKTTKKKIQLHLWRGPLHKWKSERDLKTRSKPIITVLRDTQCKGTLLAILQVPVLTIFFSYFQILNTYILLLLSVCKFLPQSILATSFFWWSGCPFRLLKCYLKFPLLCPLIHPARKCLLKKKKLDKNGGRGIKSVRWQLPFHSILFPVTGSNKWTGKKKWHHKTGEHLGTDSVSRQNPSSDYTHILVMLLAHPTQT